MNNIELKNKTILITGAAGFIGANLVMKLIKTGESMELIGLDNMNDYYDVSLKEYRLAEIEKLAAENPQIKWNFVKGDLADKALIDKLFTDYMFDIVVNLAAQAGVRYSITNPDAYINSNIIGFYNILEACRHSYDDGAKGVEHLVYASSSSVYGGNKRCHFQPKIWWTTLFRSMLRRKRAMSFWRIPTQSFTIFRPPDSVFSRFTDLPDALIWRIAALQTS